MTAKRHVPWILMPFYAIWLLIAFIIQLTGRVVGVVLALALMIAGIVATLTVVGAIVGIPLLIIGFLLLLRSIF
ncbi:MAG: hypothetical protein P4N41_04690 [Negativicutes bacterium]|jgi:hypothetical protein|nr:hypothetical protein [Negativicutes bacterium]MDR3588937.1 hypothetical protein [Negativicutes bacterium]